MTSWGVAVVGCGTVGGGTAEILTTTATELTRRTGTQFPLVTIVDRDFTHARSLGLDPGLFCSSLDQMLIDPRVKIVVELAGGTGFAKTVVEKALLAGKHVVTANKALLATHGRELFALARSKGLCIGYEASCAGGIPIVRTIHEDLCANRILVLAGIVNGTCNYILSAMADTGLDYQTALTQAQQLGFAEADPFLDVSGTDSAHKLSLLVSAAFGRWIDWTAIPLKGLETVTVEDLAAAATLGARIKLLARCEERPQGLALSVEPTAIELPHPLATLSGPFNGVVVTGSQTGNLYFQGRGAGARPTASAVVADLAGIASGSLVSTQRDYSQWPDLSPLAQPLSGDGNLGPWLIHRGGTSAQRVTGRERRDLEAEGWRVLPWFETQE